MFNIRGFKKNKLHQKVITNGSLVFLTNKKNFAYLNKQKMFSLRVFYNYILFSYTYIRKALRLPSLRVRTRSKKKTNDCANVSRYFLTNNYPENNKYLLAEFYNVIWFVFFTYEWYVTFFYNNLIQRKTHKKNIKFSHKDLLYRKVISHGNRKKKSKKNTKKKKTSGKEFNIGFYYWDTIKFFRHYLYYNQ